jgi:Methyltransferase domain
MLRHSQALRARAKRLLTMLRRMWPLGELHDRMLIRQGDRVGQRFPEVEWTERPPAGELEQYFDANTTGPGIWKWQHCFPAYERHLSRFKGQGAHLVEIGVFSGGSLPMWRDYLGPGCYITGIDIEPACKAYEAEGISVVIGDQSDPTFWRRFLQEARPIDVVIDDGSHWPAHQITTLKALLPMIRPGGVFICEDTSTFGHDFSRFIDGLTRNIDTIKPSSRPGGGDASDTTSFQRAVASVHRYPFMTVIERAHDAPGRFEGARHGTEWQPFRGRHAGKPQRLPASRKP